MNKKELILRACETLRANDIRKPVSVKGERFTITDERGDSAVFTIARKDRKMHYNATDVGNVLDALIASIEDSIRRGEPVSIRGFGAWEVRKTKEHMVREPDQEIWHTIPEQYRAKFTSGCNLQAAARSYGLQEKETGAEQYLPPPMDEVFFDEDEDDDSELILDVVDTNDSCEDAGSYTERRGD